MKSRKSTVLSGMMLCLLVACTSPAEIPTTVSQTAATMSTTQEAGSFPLANPGLFHVGMRTFELEDVSCSNCPISITVWYPADQPDNWAVRDALPDFSGAPYPLLLSSTKMARIFAPYLVSHGFTWVSVDGIDTYPLMNEQVIDQPLDILFALNQVATTPPEGLEGLLDTNLAGAIGYSFDGYNALAMSGARIDPAYYLAQCPTPDAVTEAILSPLSSFSCEPADSWNDFAAYARDTVGVEEDGLWSPMTDSRIRAVMSLAGEGWWLFGKRGLATVDRPVLVIAATQDDLYPENALIFEHLGTADKTLISFIGPDHMMVYNTTMVDRMAHFAVAFFGYHLQDREELGWYFSEEFVAQHDDLGWGVYASE